MLLQRLDDLDARNVLIRGPVTEIEEEIESPLDETFDLTDRSLLPLQRRHMPFRLGHEGTWIARPVVLGEGVRVEVLRREKTDSQW